MAKIKEFNRQNIKDVRNEIEAALKAVGDKLGLTISLGNMSYDNATLRSSNFSAIVNEPTAASPLQIRTSKLVGFKDSVYGKTFVYDNVTYTITQLKPANKRQVIAKCPKGNGYAFPKEMVFRAAPELKA